MYLNPYTEQLEEEHKGIKLALDILEKICQKLESKEKVDPSDLEKILEFIRVFADKCHHGKEEDLLFPAIEEAGIPKDGGPTGVMVEEHNLGREYVKGFGEGVSAFAAGNEQARTKIVENARNYIQLLSQHIDKEDNILYMIADMHLSQEKQNELLKQFEKVEEEKIGKGKHEEFHKMLEELKAKYISV